MTKKTVKRFDGRVVRISVRLSESEMHLVRKAACEWGASLNWFIAKSLVEEANRTLGLPALKSRKNL